MDRSQQSIPSGDQMLEDMRLVGLKEMVDSDVTLNELYKLDYGEQADRLDINNSGAHSKLRPILA